MFYISFAVVWYLIGIVCTIVLVKYDEGEVCWGDVQVALKIGLLGPLIILFYLFTKIWDFLDINVNKKFW